MSTPGVLISVAHKTCLGNRQRSNGGRTQLDSKRPASQVDPEQLSTLRATLDFTNTEHQLN
eukprot:6073592-Alexandrium_andersonii.AAC.1